MTDLFSTKDFGDTSAGPLYLQLHRRIVEAIAWGG